MGQVKGSRDLLLEFWDPLHISQMVEARNIKFGMQIGREAVTWPTFMKFLDPSISRKRLKLETSNLAGRLATSGPTQKMQN